MQVTPQSTEIEIRRILREQKNGAWLATKTIAERVPALSAWGKNSRAGFVLGVLRSMEKAGVVEKNADESPTIWRAKAQR